MKVDTTKEALQKLKSDDKSIDVGTKPNNLQVKDPITKPDDSDAVFGAVLSEAQEEVAKAMKVPLEEARMGGVVGGSPGSGGGAGGGDGGGFGTKKGPSSGSDPNGKVLTQVQKRQLRWRIVFADNGKEHVNQLRALRVTLAIPGTLQDFFTLLDLSGPAAKFSSTIGLKQHASKFKFYNVHPPTVAMVAQELRLATVPKYLVIFLPPSMEEELASLEAQYAKGIREDQIDYTVFQIVTRPNGSYGPVVVEQKLKAGAKGQQ